MLQATLRFAIDPVLPYAAIGPFWVSLGAIGTQTQGAAWPRI